MSSRYKPKCKKKCFDISSYVNNEINRILDKSDEKVIDTLVLSGGSMKGIAQIGALHYMESKGFLTNIKTIAGTSAGSIIAALIAIGYKPIELYHFFTKLDVKKTVTMSPYNFFKKLGLDDGKRVMLVVKKLFNARLINHRITMAQLYAKTDIELIITGSCVNDKKVYYFSHKTDPNMKVFDALRISISIPIVYTPRKYKDKVFVDGGCIDNYPIAIFDDRLDRVIGIHVSEDNDVISQIVSIESYLKNTIRCLQTGASVNAIRGYEDRTINITCKSGEDINHISSMFDKGYRGATLFFKTFDYT
jgi:predicted acylesterase/phospholipase RssA